VFNLCVLCFQTAKLIGRYDSKFDLGEAYSAYNKHKESVGQLFTDSYTARRQQAKKEHGATKNNRGEKEVLYEKSSNN